MKTGKGKSCMRNWWRLSVMIIINLKIIVVYCISITYIHDTFKVLIFIDDFKRIFFIDAIPLKVMMMMMMMLWSFIVFFKHTHTKNDIVFMNCRRIQYFCLFSTYRCKCIVKSYSLPCGETYELDRFFLLLLVQSLSRLVSWIISMEMERQKHRSDCKNGFWGTRERVRIRTHTHYPFDWRINKYC